LETVTSVLRQSLQQWEWIIVNDASDDSTSLGMLAEFRNGDPRIRVVDHDVNRGPGAARNTGFRSAVTEFVVQLDGDDLLEPTMLEKLRWYMESHPEHSFAKGYTVGFGAESYVWENGFHTREAFLESNGADVLAMVRKSVHEAVGGYDEVNIKGLEDWEFWIACAAAGYWGGTVPEPLAWYRRRADHRATWENWDGSDNERAFRAQMRSKYSHLWEGGFPPTGDHESPAPASVPDQVPFLNTLVKPRPRLLLVAPWMAVGGADKFNLDLFDRLVADGWEVSVATTLQGSYEWEPEFIRRTSDVFVLPRFLRPADYPRFLGYLAASRNVDVVMVSNSKLGYELLPFVRQQHPDCAYIDVVHAEQEDWDSGGHANTSNMYRSQLDMTIVVSEHLRRWMEDRGGDIRKVSVSHLGVDTDFWRPDADERVRVRADLGIRSDIPLVVFTGRLTSEKQPDVLANTLLAIRDSGDPMTAVVAGDGDLKPWLESFVARNELSQTVSVAGAVDRATVRGFLRAADIFFLPSEREGIAVSLLEAMACGVPVVGADVGGQAELVTDSSGILIDPMAAVDQPAAYSEAIRTLIGNPGLRDEMGSAARRIVTEGFSLARMGDRIGSLVGEAVVAHQRTPLPTESRDAALASASIAVESCIRDPRSYGDHPPLATTPQPDPHGNPPPRRSAGDRSYSAAMWALGPPYRWLKRRFPRQMSRWRARIRAVTGYRR
jgi:glycosyltransferase involved in cell wall biosynthesis